MEKGIVYNLNDLAITYAENNETHYGIDYERLFGVKTEIATTTTSLTATTATETTTVSKEAITIKLEISEGPTYSPADNVCFYRVKATVTGSHSPKITWSMDISNGIFGKDIAQVNLTRDNPKYTLTAIATNSEGSATDEIYLTWGCDETSGTASENTATIFTTQNKDPKIVGSEDFYNLIAQALNILAQKDPEVYKQYASVDKIEERALNLGWSGMTNETSVYIDLVNLRKVIPQVAIIDGIAITLSHEFNHVMNRYFNGKIEQVESEKIAMMQQWNTAINIGAPDFILFWIQDQYNNLSNPQTWWWKDTSTSTSG